MIGRAYKVFISPEFEAWFSRCRTKEKEQIRSRISCIELEGHFGDYKSVSQDNTVWELRWKNGRRIYYTHLLEQNILLLLGGNKNGQVRNISEAKRIFKKKS
jgi:putative addiction module killer protein